MGRNGMAWHGMDTVRRLGYSVGRSEHVVDSRVVVKF